MFRRRFLIGIFLAAGLSLAFYVFFRSNHHHQYQEGKNYNILLISLDTARADHLGCYGNSSISTPNIDSLARNGVLFRNFYSTINTTLAAHCSMFTGLYPRNHGVGRNSMRLHERIQTLSEMLQSHGYQTAAFVGAFALASVFRLNQGFQVYDESFISNASDYIAEEVKGSTKKNGQLENLVFNKKVGQISRNAESVNRAFFRWLEKNGHRKFFAFVHYYDPHFPYDPPESYKKKRLTTIPPETPLTQADRQNISFKDLMSAEEGGKYPELLQALLQLYAAEIEYCDFGVGQILKKLNELQLTSKTIIIVTADHGETLVEHPEFNSFFQHGTLTFEAETHVPFIIAAAGLLPSGRHVDQLSSQIDMLPTLVDIAGFDPPEAIDGISLVDTIRSDQHNEDRKIYSEASQPRVSLRRDAPKMVWINDFNSASLHWGKYNYITIPYLQHEALYETTRDSHEEKNLFHQFSLSKPEMIGAFRESIENWRKKANSATVDKTFRLSEEEREKLKSLGYAQ